MAHSYTEVCPPLTSSITTWYAAATDCNLPSLQDMKDDGRPLPPWTPTLWITSRLAGGFGPSGLKPHGAKPISSHPQLTSSTKARTLPPSRRHDQGTCLRKNTTPKGYTPLWFVLFFNSLSKNLLGNNLDSDSVCWMLRMDHFGIKIYFDCVIVLNTLYFLVIKACTKFLCLKGKAHINQIELIHNDQGTLHRLQSRMLSSYNCCTINAGFNEAGKQLMEVNDENTQSSLYH